MSDAAMTNAAPAPIIPDGYALARLNATNRPAVMRAINAACRRYIDEVWLQIETMIKAYGVRENPDNVAWLASALLIPDEVWAEYQREFPKRYKKRYDKMQDLRQRAEDGEWSGAADEADRQVRAASRAFTPRQGY